MTEPEKQSCDSCLGYGYRVEIATGRSLNAEAARHNGLGGSSGARAVPCGSCEKGLEIAERASRPQKVEPKAIERVKPKTVVHVGKRGQAYVAAVDESAQDAAERPAQTGKAGLASRERKRTNYRLGGLRR